jgi:hypothetical protein
MLEALRCKSPACRVQFVELHSKLRNPPKKTNYGSPSAVDSKKHQVFPLRDEGGDSDHAENEANKRGKVES